MELFLVTIFTALMVAVAIENGSCSLDHPVLEFASTRQRQASSSSSRRISILIHKRAAAATIGLAGFGRGRNHFDPEKDGFFDDFGLKKGQYQFGQKENLDFTDIRNNVPGEPGIDYAAYLKIPRTRFSCTGRTQGYYADEETGCQVFHVCGGGEGVDNDQISSFLCPVGSLFSQHLLTCDWWSKVVCDSSSSNTTQDYAGDNGATDLVMMKRVGQRPKKPTFRERQEGNDMEINEKQISLQKKLEDSHFAGANFADGDERASSFNKARTTINQSNEQSRQQGSLTANTTAKEDERLVESNQHSTEEKKHEITSTLSLKEIDNDAKVTGEIADIDGPSFTEKTNIDQSQHMTRRKLDETKKDTAAAVADETKCLSESDTLKADNVSISSTEMRESGDSNDAVSAAGIINQSRRDNGTAVKYLHEDVSTYITSAARDKNGFVVTHGEGSSSINSTHQTVSAPVVNVNRYKTQNIHNISGFKINRPVVVAVAAIATESEKFHSNLNFNPIYHQRQPAMQPQLARPPQTYRQSKDVLLREKIKSNLENYSNEQNPGRTNLTEVSWQKNIGQAGIQEYSTNDAVKRTKYLEQQELKHQLASSSLRRTLYGRRRHPHDMKYTVNYHTHYYPEIYRRSATAAADHVDVGNINKYKTNHNEDEEANYPVPYDESQSSIICYQHYDDAVSEVEQKQSEFGSRIHTAAAAAAAAAEVVDNENYHYQQYSAIVNNPENSRNAYKINSELQTESRGLAVVGHVQTAAVATAPAKDNLPRPFTAATNDAKNYLHAMHSHTSEDDANYFSVSDYFEDPFEHTAVTAAATSADDERTIIVNAPSTSAGADDEKMPVDDSYKSEYIQRASAKEEEEKQEEEEQ